MKRLIGLGVVAMAAITFGGCAASYMTAVPSVQGRTYVIRNGQEMWNCDATSGEPVCYQTKKVYQPVAAKK